MNPSDEEVNKKTEVNVQGQIKLMSISEKSTRIKLYVDLIGPYSTYEREA